MTESDVARQLFELGLPDRAIFLDVNGTIFADSSDEISTDELQHLQQAIQKAESAGWAVGLCSDSPLVSLQNLARRLEMRTDPPLVAENGNVVALGDRSVVVRTLTDVQDVQRRIALAAESAGLSETAPVLGPEFGGELFDRSTQFAFGFGRDTSVSVFGSSAFVASLQDIALDVADAGVDCAPDSGYFAVHPLEDFRTGKRRTLELLSQQGVNVVMVGDSLADLAPPSSGVKSALVANHRLSRDEAMHAFYIARQPTAAGVAGILEWTSDNLFASRDEWIDNEVARYFDYVETHPNEATSQYASREEARTALDAITPHKPHGYPWRNTKGLALAARVEWHERGPVPRMAEFAGYTLDDDGVLSSIWIERGDSPGTLALIGGYVDSLAINNETDMEAAVRETREETQLGLDELPPGPEVYQLAEYGQRPVDGVVRQISASAIYGAFIPPEQLAGRVQSTKEAPAVFRIPVRTLLESIAAGRIKLHADHNVLAVQATAALHRRLREAPLVDERHRELLRQLDEMEPLLTHLSETAETSTLESLVPLNDVPMSPRELLGDRYESARIDGRSAQPSPSLERRSRPPARRQLTLDVGRVRVGEVSAQTNPHPSLLAKNDEVRDPEIDIAIDSKTVDQPGDDSTPQITL